MAPDEDSLGPVSEPRKATLDPDTQHKTELFKSPTDGTDTLRDSSPPLGGDDPNSFSISNRKRTARACDRCSIARTKCDGKQPCYRCLNLLIPCEYNRQIKKRGKGSELYPQNPRKVGRKVQFFTNSGRLPGTSILNLPEGEKNQALNADESPLLTAQSTTSMESDSESSNLKTKPTSSVAESLLVDLKKKKSLNEHLPSSGGSGMGGSLLSTTDPYAALMRLADTSEQHHQLSEAQKMTVSLDQNQSPLKRLHSDDALQTEYPRKSISIPSLSNTNISREEKSSRSSRWTPGSHYSEGHDSQQSYNNNQFLGNLPPISDIKSSTKETANNSLETSTPIPQSPQTLPSISSTPVLPASPTDPPLIIGSSIPNESSISLSNFSRISLPPKSSRSTTPIHGSETPHWRNVKSPFSTSDLINSMFDRASTSGINTPLHGNGNSGHNSKRNSIHELPWSGSDKAKSYPVLDPIINEIDFMPTQLVSEFLEIYFTNNTYTVAPILRRCSLLSFEKPRKCSPVLLYSILYVSAHACNHPLMTSAPDFKVGLTAKLLDRLMSYMRPWRNDNSHEYDLDEIIAYINVGIVSSASEFKGSSLRWWAIAWCMARVLKLNKENPTLPEETREERRRAWWTLFMIDRHLGLCYNRPCTLLDSESLELFFPILQDVWASESPLYPPEEDRNRRRGPQCTVIEVGLFGMYLPLMTLLGGINDMHFLGMSPVLGGKEHVLKLLRESYRHRLSAFQYSLEEYYSHISSLTTLLQAWREYCQCFIQVFHILLEGFWDPTEMLDDIDVLLNDSKFTGCLANSIQASKHVERILTLDPDLQVIPFFFGVQLLQAGFIPFCMSERYGSHTSTDVAQACEIFIRAHEVCIVTLNTQYQVNFRFIMRGVIRDMKHATISVNDRIDSTRRRRQIMSMYRWNAGGTGLAV